LGGLVVRAQEFRHTDKGLIGERPVGIRWRHGCSWDVRKHFSLLRIYADEAWGTVESDIRQMAQQGVGRRAGSSKRPTYCVAGSHDLPTVGGAS
jgi:hypothetical protein